MFSWRSTPIPGSIRAIAQLVRHFADPSVGAVAGAVYVGNATRLLTRFQALEYITSQNLDRRALELANGIIVVPGAIGAWRRPPRFGAASWAGVNCSGAG